MKKVFFDGKYFKISMYVLFVIIVSIILEKTIGNFGEIFVFIGEIRKVIITVLAPFVYGFLIAYLINSLVKFFDNKIYNKLHILNKNKKRLLSIITSFLLFFGFISWIVAYLLPELINSLKTLISIIQYSLNLLEKGQVDYPAWEAANDFIISINQVFNTKYNLNDFIDLIVEPLTQFASTLPSLVNKLLTGTMNIAYGLLNAVLGVVISFYMLYEKENYSELSTKFLYTVFNREKAARLVSGFRKANSIFEKFIIGKTVDSLIIGVLFFIIASLMNLPFVLLSSIIIGVSNMIPYFGPFIGAVPVVFITLLNNPALALWILLVIFILQQFDGIILGPKILGDSTGLKPIGVIFAILVGGKLFGVLGMFFGVPVIAVLKIILYSLLDKKYKEKYILTDKT